MTTAKNVGRINVWPSYDIAREADTEESEYVGRLTVWPTRAEALANLSDDEGGGGPEATFDSTSVTFDDTDHTLDEEAA